MKSLFLTLALAVTSVASVGELRTAVSASLDPIARTPSSICRSECAGSRYYATCMRDCLQRYRR